MKHGQTKNEPSLAARRRFLLAAPAAGAAAVSGSAFAAGACIVTDGDVLGPFYRPNARATTKLADALAEGERLLLTGTVLRPDCKTPVAGATVDLWHCDHRGVYDIKTPDEKIAPEQYRFRGITQTGKDGRFVIESIVPGSYDIPPGLEGFERYAGQTRPAHIHITIVHPLYLPLTTQIYFKGDAHIAKDPWARHSRVLADLKRRGGRAAGAVEFVLANRPGLRKS